MNSIASRPLLSGNDLETAIDRARTELATLLRGSEGAGRVGGGTKAVAEARALLGALLDRRVTEAAARMDEQDAQAVAAARADRNEAIAVTGALLYWLPAGDTAWSEVALTLGRLSYDRYTDPWPGAEPPDPDDLDAACDLLLRGARYDDADERTTLYLFLALRDRQHLMACPSDAKALMTWGKRLLTFPGAGGLGRSGLYDMLELELLGRVGAQSRASSSAPWSPRPLRLAAALVEPTGSGCRRRSAGDTGSGRAAASFRSRAHCRINDGTRPGQTMRTFRWVSGGFGVVDPPGGRGPPEGPVRELVDVPPRVLFDPVVVSAFRVPASERPGACSWVCRPANWASPRSCWKVFP